MNPKIHFIPKTDSTNLLLKRIVKYKSQNNSVLPDLFTIYTDEQTSGRGLATNKWESAAGENLLCSVYFRPPVPPNKQFAFNQCFTLAVRNVISQYVDNVMVKWPNDIYVDKRKIAGILIEHELCGDKIAYTIAGVGINVNQIEFSEKIPNPVSLKSITGNSYDKSEILQNLFENCEFYYNKLILNEFDDINLEYLKHLYRIDNFHSYIIKNQKITAKITGVNSFGQLLLVSENGQNFVCNLKEIVFI